MLNKKILKNLGFSLLELILAIAVFSLGSYAVATLLIDSNTSTRSGLERTEALSHAKEGIEAVRYIRDQDWDNLTNGSHGLDSSSGEWVFVIDTPDLIADKYTRTVSVSDRPDATSTKDISVTVSWSLTPSRISSVSLNTILTNWATTTAGGGIIIDPPAIPFSATGGDITYAGGYTYHTFTGSNDFIVTSGSESVEALIVAGGGAGGRASIASGIGGGGGGAGGVQVVNISVSVNSYPVVVGIGGVAAVGTGASGGPSSFGGTTSTGGGGGAERNAAATGGGSGGGASYYNGVAGSGIAGQGYNGGGNAGSIYGGCGGGGASQIGFSSSGDSGANGGDGIYLADFSNFGASGYFGGGGGGGARSLAGAQYGSGGVGGGGRGSKYDGSLDAVSGTQYTGGGGGGSAGNTRANGSGGSGIVIIRYLTP